MDENYLLSSYRINSKIPDDEELENFLLFLSDIIPGTSFRLRLVVSNYFYFVETMESETADRDSNEEQSLTISEEQIEEPNNKRKRTAPCKTYKIRKERKLARIAMDRIKSGTLLAQKYANYYISSRNSDPVRFENFVKSICSPSCEIEFFVASKVNHFGNFTKLKAFTADNWIESVKNVSHLSPDGIVSIEKIDFLNNNDDDAFVTYWKYSGTIINEESKFISGDENGKLVQMNNIYQRPLQAKVLKPFLIFGSTIFRKNKSNKIQSIEFCYSFLE